MRSDRPPARVEFTPLFVRFLKHLAKKYRNIQADLQPLIDRLERGETPGVRVKGVKPPTYKVRVKSGDISKGKSGGYRVIYYLRTADFIGLLAIYAKSERTDIRPQEIRRMIEDYERQSR